MSTTAKEAACRAEIEAVKKEWKLLWRSRIDDKVLAEGMANNSFPMLSVERGTVIVATRNYKPLDLREILRSHSAQDVDRVLSPPPSAGGWTKFAKTVLNKQTRSRAKKWTEASPRQSRRGNAQLKKGGRGWLHST